MKRLKFLLSTIILLISMSISAQITREQADAIIFEYIQNEVTWDYVVLRNDNQSSEDDKTNIMWINNNLHIESLSLEYPCWVYFINNPNVNGPYTILFLFINKNDGSLLEVKSNGFGENIENWTFLATNLSDMEVLNKSSDVAISPNPFSDFLDIAWNKVFSHIEIYDSSGKTVLCESVPKSTKYRVNVSHLKAGCYLLKMFDITTNRRSVVNYKLIKK